MVVPARACATDEVSSRPMIHRVVSLRYVLVVVLTFFLELAAGPAAWILFPVLGLVTFMGSTRIAMFAAEQPNPR